MNDFPIFIDVVKDEGGRLVEQGKGQTESEALIPLLNKMRDGLSAVTMPEHAVYFNTGAVVPDQRQLEYLILTSPLVHAIYTLGRQQEQLRRRQQR